MCQDLSFIKPGLRFYHKRWLTEDHKGQALCRVFAVRKGVVYFGLMNEKNASSKTSLEEFWTTQVARLHVEEQDRQD